MGEARVPLYAFVDETGNTGHNVFDQAQPDFFTAALISKGDFDVSGSSGVNSLAKHLGVAALHGRELGLHRLQLVADRLIEILAAQGARFFVSRVEKQYLVISKIFDSLLDSGENAAVGWHHYNLRPLRLMLVFKLSAIVTADAARLFWQCIIEPNKEKAYCLLPVVCDLLLAEIHRLPDARSRQILTDGLVWARDHRESIQIHTDRKISRQGHFPNLVAFINLLDGLDSYAREHKKTVACVKHDTQSEFAKTLAMWHEIFSNASPEELEWAGETHSFQKLPGSEFQVSNDAASVGIQVADVVLWLYSQFRKGIELPPACVRLVRFVLSNGWENDFSFAGVERSYMQKFGAILDKPLNAEMEAKVRTILAQAEDARQQSMTRYDSDGIPPFMRRASLTTETDAEQPMLSPPNEKQ